MRYFFHFTLPFPKSNSESLSFYYSARTAITYIFTPPEDRTLARFILSVRTDLISDSILIISTRVNLDNIYRLIFPLINRDHINRGVLIYNTYNNHIIYTLVYICICVGRRAVSGYLDEPYF